MRGTLRTNWQTAEVIAVTMSPRCTTFDAARVFDMRASSRIDHASAIGDIPDGSRSARSVLRY